MVFIFFAVGFVVSLVVASMLGRTRRRLIMAGGAIVAWAAYTIYAETLASCPAHGECDKTTGAIFLGGAVVGVLIGTGLSWAVRRPQSLADQR
jgi:hypothetical protein